MPPSHLFRLRACLPLCAFAILHVPAPAAPPVNLAPLARAQATDAMDGLRRASRTVDGNLDTPWTVWAYHIPKDREAVSIELTWWRAVRVQEIRVHWAHRPGAPEFAVRTRGREGWDDPLTPDASGEKRARFRWDTPQEITGFRIRTPREAPDIAVGEIEVLGDPGEGLDLLEHTLPPPGPAPEGAGELPATLTRSDGMLDLDLDGVREVSRIEVDWTRAPIRSALELVTADGRRLLAHADRFRTVYDLPETLALKHLRVIPLEGPEPAAERVRVLGPGGLSAGESPALQIWTEVALRKVSRRAQAPAAGNDTVALALARNEYEAGQIVLRNPGEQASARGIAVRVGDLTSDAGEILSAARIAWNPLGYVNYEHTDPLLEPEPFDVPPASCRPVWITVHAPPDQPPGTYRGTVEILQPGHPVRPVKIEATVWPVTLPKDTSIESTYFGIWGVESRLGPVLADDAARAKLAREIAEDYARHRLFAGMHPFAQDNDRMMAAGEKGDFRELEEWARFWQERGIPFEISIGWDGGKGGPERYRRWARELEKRGWDGAVTVCDEPRGKVDAVVEACEKLAQWAPYLKPKSAFKSCPAGYEFSYIGLMREWGYQPRAWSDDAIGQMTVFNREREAAGEKVFWYIHTFVPLARPAYLHRMYFWALWKYQVRGPMLYSTCEWDFNAVDRCLDEFTISQQVDGQGTLLWPGRSGFLDSVRWETLRDGIEDFDLHRVLRDGVDALAKTNPDSPLVAKSRDALFDTDRVFRTFQNEGDTNGYALRMHAGGGPWWAARGDPADLYAARERIARLAAQVDRARRGAHVLHVQPERVDWRTVYGTPVPPAGLTVANVGECRRQQHGHPDNRRLGMADIGADGRPRVRSAHRRRTRCPHLRGGRPD